MEDENKDTLEYIIAACVYSQDLDNEQTIEELENKLADFRDKLLTNPEDEFIMHSINYAQRFINALENEVTKEMENE